MKRSPSRVGVAAIIRHLRFIVIAFWLIVVLFPLTWIAMTSLKSSPDIFVETPKLIFTPTLVNFEFGSSIIDPITKEPIFAGIAAQFPRYLANSIINALLSTAIALSVGILLAYSLSRLRVPGTMTLLTLLLGLHAVTPIVFTPALFELFRRTGLHDTYLGISLMYATFALPLTTWILKSFFDGFPKHVEDAAKVDGASTLRILFGITLPQLRVGLTVAAIFAFMIAWNDFVFTLTLTETRAATFVFLADFFDDLLRAGVLAPGPLTSMSIVHMIPSFIFAFLIQRYLLLGFSAGTIRREVD